MKIPSYLMFAAGTGSSIIAKHEEGEKSLRAFTMNAYNGGPMDVGFTHPVVVDLAGMSVSGKQRPILLNHDSHTPVGHSVGANGGNGIDIRADRLIVSGVFSHDNEHSRQVIASSDNGAEWQSSIGASIEAVVFIEEGEAAEANGQTFDGPVLIARRSTLKENSFVMLGADDSTSTSVAASNTQITEKGVLMKTFEEWLKANGHDLTKMSEGEVKFAQAAYDSEQLLEAATKPQEKPKAPEKKPEIQASFDVVGFKKELQAEMLEQNKIANLCAKHPDIQEEAIKAGWNSDQIKDKIDLKELRAERDSFTDDFNIGSGQSSDMEGKHFEIGLLRAGMYNEKKLIEEYSEKDIEAADKQFKGRLGLQEVVMINARMNGYSGGYSYKSDEREVFARAFQVGPYMQAGTRFGTLSLPGILSNTANKFFRDGFNFVEDAWRSVTAIGTVSDFKQISTYTLTGNMTFEKVGPGGEIRSGEVDETAYTNQAETYAKMFGITRNDLINDDLDALSRVPGRLGRGAGIAFNQVFWTEFNDNAAFFSLANDNLLPGSALDLARLTEMDTALDDQVDPDGNPMNSDQGRILLTGSSDKVLARSIFNDTFIIDGTSTDRQTDGNPFKGLFTPVMSTYATNSTFGGTLGDAYLIASPSENPVIETVFLNGVQEPTIETADARFDLLGVDMRGWFDFGVNKQEFRGGVKSTVA